MPDSFDPVEYINAPRWRHSSLGLERVRLLMGELGDPQDDFDVVHVAGTNGKGSVCAYVDSILRCARHRCGLFTSPYIERFEERIRVDGADIPADSLSEVTLAVRDAAEEVERECGEHPTEFELMFAVACVYFSRAGCDIAVMEVGLGGRLDATNVVNPRVCAIARIGVDHADILGDTVTEIAGEKAGIIKAGVPVVSFPQEVAAMRVIEERCVELGCVLTVPDFSQLDVQALDMADGVRHFAYEGVEYETGLLARYQPENAAVAIEIAKLLGVDARAIAAGIAKAAWPGRFEVVCRQPLVIVDGSHNPQGAEALAQSLEELLGGAANATDVAFVMGVLADKDYQGIIAPIASLARRFYVYTPDNPRALPAEELAQAIRAASPADVRQCATPSDAIRAAMQKEGPESVIVAFGTLYAIGEIKSALRRL